MKQTTRHHHVTVIGAGVVGLCAALRLRTDGHSVTLIDPRQPGSATSYGNAGVVSAGALMPYSTPGLWAKIPWMLMNDKSPLALPWKHLHHSLPWLVKFLAAGASQRKIEYHAAAMAPLLKRTVGAHRALMDRHRIDPLLVRPTGWLNVYKRGSDIDLRSLEFQLWERHGMEVDIVDGDALFQLEPGLSRTFTHGVLEKNDSFVIQPIALSQAYFDAFMTAGGEIRHEAVRGFEVGPDGPYRIITDLGMHDVDYLVIAAGAWSKTLVELLGTRVPLEAERGYHVNVPWSEGLVLNRPVFVDESYYVMCPMHDGVRITSGTDFGGVNLPPDFRRIRRMLADARQALPGLENPHNREWMGHRPSLPDSRPVIGRSPNFNKVFFAFGHSHLGLTLSAITSEVVSDLIAQRNPEFDLQPFRADRF